MKTILLTIMLLTTAALSAQTDSSQTKAGAKIKHSVSMHLASIGSATLGTFLTLRRAGDPSATGIDPLAIIFGLGAIIFEGISLSDLHKAGQHLTEKK